MEMIGTCVLLGILMSMTVPIFAIIARERRATEQRQFALQTATNLLEFASGRSWSELTPGELAVPAASSDTQTVLPGFEQSLVVQQFEGPEESRQITAVVRWKDHSDQFVTPVQLSSWVYPMKEVP